MKKSDSTHSDKVSVEILEKALNLACHRIADSSQRYEEANTADGWYEVFIQKAESDQKPHAVKM